MLDTATDSNHPCRERAILSIYRMPRRWVLDNLEQEIQPLFDVYEDEGYTLIITLYEAMHFTKAIEWAKKAVRHDNPDIREIGQDWLELHQIADTNE